jgi:hypothetical protein
MDVFSTVQGIRLDFVKISEIRGVEILNPTAPPPARQYTEGGN